MLHICERCHEVVPKEFIIITIINVYFIIQLTSD